MPRKFQLANLDDINEDLIVIQEPQVAQGAASMAPIQQGASVALTPAVILSQVNDSEPQASMATAQNEHEQTVEQYVDIAISNSRKKFRSALESSDPSTRQFIYSTQNLDSLETIYLAYSLLLPKTLDQSLKTQMQAIQGELLSTIAYRKLNAMDPSLLEVTNMILEKKLIVCNVDKKISNKLTKYTYEGRERFQCAIKIKPGKERVFLDLNIILKDPDSLQKIKRILNTTAIENGERTKTFKNQLQKNTLLEKGNDTNDNCYKNPY